LGDLYGKNRAGKTILSVPTGSKSLTPKLISQLDKEFVAVVSSIGNLLVFPLKELPQLSKGKGNKLMSIPSAKVATREEYVVDVAVLNSSQNLLVMGDSKPFVLKPSDWKNFVSERAKRGGKLPRGVRRVAGLKVE
jgi:topoisomerase-4 subunit A